MTGQATVAEQIADWLVRQGIRQGFVVTGGGAMFLNQAFGSHPGFHCTYMHHEQACAMAAEGYARIAGVPAVVNVTTGPGAINALNGVFGAFTDSIPMLIVSGQVKRETCLDFRSVPRLRQLGDQEAPTTAVAGLVTKGCQLVREPEDLEQLLPWALETAVSGRPGPVWIDIPIDIQSARIPLRLPDTKSSDDANETDGLDGVIPQVIERLGAAHRPLILAGTGVRLGRAVEPLLRLVEETGIPLATAWTHDLIASDHPLYAGRPGTIGTRDANLIAQQADVLLVIASRLNLRQIGYNWQAFARDAFIIQVDIDPAELSKPTVQPDLPIAASAATFLSALLRQISGAALGNYSPWVQWCQSIRRRFHAFDAAQQDEGPINPYPLVARIFEHLGADDIVVCGNASACIIPFQVGHLKAGQRMFSNSGSASMGYDLPAAIGAAIAAPERRVVCFAGDGSLQMNIQELQTVAALRPNLLILVLCNNGYLSIRQTHENFFGRVVGATPETGISFPDYGAVARAYGIPALRISTSLDFPALDQVLRDGNGPILCELLVDPAQGFEPRIRSRVSVEGQFISPELDDMYPYLDTDELREIRAEAKRIRQLQPRGDTQ